MLPAVLTRVEGPNLVLRLIRPEDAEYVHGLRTDAAYNAHLSEVRGTAHDQRRWIEAYKEREADRQELYYVIERKDGIRCGVVRLYNFVQDSFNWGSWILDHNKTPKAALESVVLSFGVGFDGLGLSKALVGVRLSNERALAIYESLEMTELRRDGNDIFLTYPRSRFQANRAGYLLILGSEQAG
jgi:hypothetical protein